MDYFKLILLIIYGAILIYRYIIAIDETYSLYTYVRDYRNACAFREYVYSFIKCSILNITLVLVMTVIFIMMINDI